MPVFEMTEQCFSANEKDVERGGNQENEFFAKQFHGRKGKASGFSEEDFCQFLW